MAPSRNLAPLLRNNVIELSDRQTNDRISCCLQLPRLWMINAEGKLQGDRAACAKPPVEFKSKVPLWPSQARTGQAKAELLI